MTPSNCLTECFDEIVEPAGEFCKDHDTDTFVVAPRAFDDLLRNGATIEKLNRPFPGKNYVHSARLKGITFVTKTDYEVLKYSFLV